MDLLKRDLAPILPEGWKAIDAEATRVLSLNLAGRKVVDLRGPLGWKFAAVSTGRIQALTDEPKGLTVGLRSVQPLLEVRTAIQLELAELDAISRGVVNLDLGPVVRAAEMMASCEDRAIFHSHRAGGIVGIIESSPHAPMPVTRVEDWPKVIVRAKEVLRAAGVGGPYALVLGKRAYDDLSAASEDGYPLRKRIEPALIDGPIVWAPALDGAVLASARGGDFELTIGQDLSVGYSHHDERRVDLYLTESFTFRVLEPAAALWLTTA